MLECCLSGFSQPETWKEEKHTDKTEREREVERGGREWGMIWRKPKSLSWNAYWILINIQGPIPFLTEIQPSYFSAKLKKQF